MRRVDLADPSLWRKVHNLWISELYVALKPQVAGRLGLAIDQEVRLVQMGSNDPVARVRPDVHLTDMSPETQPHAPSSETVGQTVVYAEGTELVETESRHFIIIRDLAGDTVVGALELLSPTNKGWYGRTDLDAFEERRRQLLATDAAYAEVDAVAGGKRWLPRCLEELAPFAGVAWTSIPRGASRFFRGWAWRSEGPLPLIPWDLGRHGSLQLDLDRTFSQALAAAGLQQS